MPDMLYWRPEEENTKEGIMSIKRIAWAQQVPPPQISLGHEKNNCWFIRNLNLQLHLLLLLQTLFMSTQNIFYICPVNITALNAFFGFCSVFHYPMRNPSWEQTSGTTLHETQ